MPRLTRAENRLRTRGALVDTAERLFIERGFHSTSVEDVAEEAGFSKGAVYSNFESKDDLFLAVLAKRVDSRAMDIEPGIDRRADLDDQVSEAGQGFFDVFLGDPGWSLLLIEYAAHAARHPELRAGLAARNRRIRADMARLVDEHLEALGLEAPVSSDTLALILFALGNGIIMEKLVDDEAVGGDTFGAALGLMLAAVQPRVSEASG